MNQHFKSVQREWVKWGVIVVAAAVIACAAIFFVIEGIFKSHEVYRLSVVRLEANPAAVEQFGKPMSMGFPAGRISTSNSDVTIDLSYSVSGPNGNGIVYVFASKELG